MSMNIPGAALKKIRLEKGLTLEEVQKKTKIHLNILKAIEEDSLVNLSPVYIKGFLKIYCGFLGVDPKDYIAGYKEPKGAPQYVIVDEEKTASFRRSNLFIEISSRLRRLNVKKSLIILLAVVLGVGIFNLSKMLAANYKKYRLARKTSLAMGIPLKEQKAPIAKIQKVPQASTIRLGVHVKENCRVSLRCDGRQVFGGILRKGMSEEWIAKNKIELFLSNAAAVELDVNNQRFSGLGRKGQALNILITKEGLRTLR